MNTIHRGAMIAAAGIYDIRLSVERQRSTWKDILQRTKQRNHTALYLDRITSPPLELLAESRIV